MAAEALTDQETQFKKRARRRLIGAVALVLLMVTALPMLLDDRGDQNAPHPDVAISIPSQDDGNFSSKIVPVVPATPAPAAAEQPVQLAAPLAPPKQEPPAVAPVPKVEAVPEHKAAPEPVPQPKAKVSVEKPEPVAKPVQRAEKKPEQKAENKTEQKPSVTPRVESVPAPTEKAAHDQPSTGKGLAMTIQVGVFSDATKVDQIKSKLKEVGVPCGTEQLDTKNGVKIRLRCGSYSSRAEAEKGQETLKAAGFSNSMLVTHP